MTEFRYPSGALVDASSCLVCAAPATHRVALIVADGVSLRESSCPLCDAHQQAEASRWVRVTLLLIASKLGPVVLAWSLGQQLGLSMPVAVAGALAGAAVLTGLERAILPRLQPRVRATGLSDNEVTLEIEGAPPKTLEPGGPARSSLRTATDRTRPRLAVSLLVLAASALVAGWQHRLAHPSLTVHNPGSTKASVMVDGGSAHILEPGAHVVLSPGAGRHKVVLASGTSRLEMPVDLASGAPMLLATEPACYGIGLALAAPALMEGQLFTLGTGEWRPVNCGD